MSCKKSLMTYEHSLFETLPCQFFRSGKAAHVQEVAVLIYNRGFTVQHVRQFASVDRVYHLLQSVIFMETVACIEEAEIISRGE